jgi:integrase
MDQGMVEIGGKAAIPRANAYLTTNQNDYQPQHCPECDSLKYYRDGWRYTPAGKVQRFLCRTCGFRFSQASSKPDQKVEVRGEPGAFEPSSDLAESSICDRDSARKKIFNDDSLALRENVTSHDVTVSGKDLNALRSYSSNRQVCVTEQGAKNLAETAADAKTVAGDSRKIVDKATMKGLLLQYALYLQKEGYGENCRYVSCIRMLLNSHCDVYNSENVKEIIAKKAWKNGTKMQTCYAYDALTKMLGLSWIMPTYKQEQYLFFLPEESELDALINATKSQRLRTYLQTLKETWADPSEALGLRWIDVDTNRNVIAINHPVKDHNAREIEVTPRLIAMLNMLPKTSKLIFDADYRNMQSTFLRLRKRLAHDLQNPRILSISFVSFRHWGGTMLAWLSNGNVLIVKEKLGHKNVKNTMKYIGRIDWKLNQDFDVATASTDDEIRSLGAAGYQKYDERMISGTTISYYRRPKRFGSVKT